MSSLLRSIKNVTNGYTPAQIKVRNATSNDEFGPSTHELHEIADLTRSNQELFFIMDMIDKRLNDKGKNWRHVLKSLTLLDYLVRYGSDNVIIWCKENFYVIKSLREFQYRDEAGEDHGIPIRARAKELTSLLNNTDRLKAERAQARSGGRRRAQREYRSDSDEFQVSSRSGNRNRSRSDLADRGDRPGRPSRYRSEGSYSGSGSGSGSRRTPDAEQDELQRAIELSKQTVQEDEKRRAQLRSGTDDLNKAVQMSSVQQQQTGLYTQEDWQSYQAAQLEYQQYQQQLQQQQQQLEQQQQQLAQQAQATGFGYQNTGYQQQPGVQQQATGFQQQATGFQPQNTGFDQTYGQAQAQPQAQPQSGYSTYPQSSEPQALQPVKTGSNNPFAAQATGVQSQSMGYSGYSQQQAQSYPQGYTQQHDTQQHAQQPVQPQHTNNPFQQHQQYTGIATTQMQPSHTGYGFGNQRGAPQGDSLIDL